MDDMDDLGSRELRLVDVMNYSRCVGDMNDSIT